MPKPLLYLCRFAQHWDATLMSMYRAVQLCVPKPVLSTYPPPIAAAPNATDALGQPVKGAEVVLSEKTALRGAAAATAGTGSIDGGSVSGGGGQTRNGSDGSSSSVANSHGAGADAPVTKETPIIRICSGDFRQALQVHAVQALAYVLLVLHCCRFGQCRAPWYMLTCRYKTDQLSQLCNGGPHHNVFRFSGSYFSPRGHSVRVPFAAGTVNQFSCLTGHLESTQQRHVDLPCPWFDLLRQL